MSGGSWDHVYRNFADVADRLKASPGAERRALGEFVQRITVAMHDIEWVDSGDYGPGDELKAIREALPKEAVLVQLIEEGKRLRDALEKEIHAIQTAKEDTLRIRVRKK